MLTGMNIDQVEQNTHIHDIRLIPLSNWPKNTERPPEDVPCSPQTTVSLKGRGVKSSG